MKTKMLALLFLAAPMLAAPPRITNGTVQVVPSLAQAQSTGSGWIGYAVASAKGFSSCGCSLTSNNNNISREDDDGPTTVLFFVRMRDGRPDRFRFLSTDCEIRAG